MREIRVALGWSIVTAGLIALFWAIWGLNSGSVPVVTSIRMTENWTLVLPFGISRWRDILIGPIWSTAVVFLMTNKRVKEDQYLVLGLILGLILGLAYGLGFGLGYGLVFGLAGGLAFGLAGGLGLGLAYGLGFGLAFGLSYGLVFGLAFALAYGLIFGLVVLLAGRRL